MTSPDTAVVSPINKLHSLAAQFGHNEAASTEQLMRVSIFDALASLEAGDHSTYQTELFLKSVAIILFQTTGQPSLRSACVRACGLLLVNAPQQAFSKKLVIVQQFGTLADLIYVIRVAVERAQQPTHTLALAELFDHLADTVIARQHNTPIPEGLQDSLTYLAEILAYYAAYPGEVIVHGEDYLSLDYLIALERYLNSL